MILNSRKLKKLVTLHKNRKNLVYLDSAATSLTPEPVIDAMNEFYNKYNANVHRGVHELSVIATEMYERARGTVAQFLNANENEIIFTSGTTAGLNALAYGLEHLVGPDDTIVLTRLEHHANLVPWLEVAKRTGANIRYIEITANGAIDEASILDVIDESAKIVSFTQLSNTIGTIVSVEKIIARAKEMNAITIVDAAQSIAHHVIDVKKMECDFLVFSGHKAYGPTGTGVIYGRMNALEQLEPSAFGGGMISRVEYDHATWASIPGRFEAGTPNIAGALGLAAGLRFLKSLEMHAVEMHISEQTKYLLNALSTIPKLRIIGPRHMSGIVSFVIDGVHAFDVGTLLDAQGIAIRTGHLCTQPLLKLFGVPSVIRISLSVFLTEDDIDRAVKAIKKSIEELTK